MNRRILAVAACGIVLGACSGAPPARPATVSPTPAPTPALTPSPTPRPRVVVPPPANFAREYKTNNFAQRWNTSGALVFDSFDAVKACFSRVYFGRSTGFKPCEEKALAVLPQGLSIKLLEAFDADAIAKVEILEGEKKGLVGYMHELWIAPSPWSTE